MLVGIVADVRKAETGEFVLEVMPDTIADGLSEALAEADRYDDYDADDYREAGEILDFLTGPLGRQVKWWVQ